MYCMHDSKLVAKDFVVLITTFEVLLHIDQNQNLELLQMFFFKNPDFFRQSSQKGQLIIYLYKLSELKLLINEVRKMIF